MTLQLTRKPLDIHLKAGTMNWNPDHITETLEIALSALESQIDKPVRRPFRGGFVFRYVDEGIEQAIIQKLARIITGLRAALLLLEAGYFQEVGVLQRVLGDLDEEVRFLCHALIRDEVTELHSRFLEGFYTETFVDAEAEAPSVQTKIPKVPRKEIREYLETASNALTENSEDESKLKSYEHQISTLYSGFVHGSSPSIMSMFGGPEMEYQLRGMRMTPLYESHRDDLWNQFYRSILIFYFAAFAFGDRDTQAELLNLKRETEILAGVDYGSDDDV